MAKPRATTIQQRFGFLDKDLITSKHDEIMLWLDKQIREWVHKTYQGYVWKPEWVASLCERANSAIATKIANVKEYHQWSSDRAAGKTTDNTSRNAARESPEHWAQILTSLENWSGLGDPPPVPIPEVKITWEYPVKSDKYIVGFIDMVAYYITSSLDIANVKYNQWEKGGHLSDENKLPEWYIHKSGNVIRWLFEIKSTIPSLGEIIRQIRMYQEYESGNYYIVSPDDCHKDTLKDQGIGFIKYEPTDVLTFYGIH